MQNLPQIKKIEKLQAERHPKENSPKQNDQLYIQ